jgi:uncharacterized protein YndB with AHSA1/START domain
MAETIASKMTLTLLSDCEVSVTRAFDAPRALVFEAFSSCAHMSKWWGPRGFDLTGCDMDLKAGGSYRFVQKAPDGSIHAFHGTFREVSRPERIVCTQVYEPVPDQEMVVSTTFTEKSGKTVLSQVLTFSSMEARDGMVAGGMEWGEAQSFDRLEELLAELGTGGAA